MQKIIGLDLGTYSIKAVEIINNFNSYEISQYYEKIIPQVAELPKDALIQHCLEELFVEQQIQADRIVTALPGQYTTSRIMSFNFSDPRKIDAAVESELEDIVPFDLEDMIVDQQIMGQLQGKTQVLVVMTKKNHLANFLNNLMRVNIDPRLVDIDSLAFYNLSSAMQLPSNKCVGFIDVGHEKTSICFVENGVLRMYRTINVGGRYITEFIARDMQLSFNEAQRIKHQEGRINLKEASASMIKTDVSTRIALAANTIVKEIGRTLYSFKTYEKAPVEQVYLSGGTAQIEDFDKYLSEQLNIQVHLTKPSTTSLVLHKDLQADGVQMMQSVAIGMRAISSVKRVSSINLRKGEFAYVQDYEKILNYGFGFLKMMSVISIVFLISYVLHYFAYQAQIAKIQDHYKKSVLKTFSDMSTKLRQANFAKVESDVKKRYDSAVMERRNSIQSFIDSNQGSAPLIVLSQISDAIKKETVLDTTLFQYSVTKNNQGKLVFKAEVKDYATGTEVLEALKSVKVLTNVVEKSSGTKPGSTLIDYTIHADLKEGVRLSENM